MRTSRNFFAVLMVMVSGIGLWMGGNFLFSLHQYFLLTETAPAIVSAWEVKEMKPGRFSIETTVEFKAGERVFYHRYHFPKPVYQNPYLAEELIKKWETDSWNVWYNKKDPQIASLQKSFPMKVGIYFALCLGVFLYFAWLRVYVQKMGSVDPR